MLRCRARYGLVLLVVAMAGVRAGAAECDALDAIRDQWKRTRALLMPISEAIPEEKYDYKPTPEVRSFREMLLHMATDTHTHMGFVVGMSREESEKLTEKYHGLKTRAELLGALGEAFDYGDKILADLNDQNAMEMVTGHRDERMTRISAALDVFTDIVDHYGNLVVYLRLNGIVPPSTAARQAQRQQRQQQQGEEHQP